MLWLYQILPYDCSSLAIRDLIGNLRPHHIQIPKQLSAYLTPAILSIGNIQYEELGMGYYPFINDPKGKIEGGIIVDRMLDDKWSGYAVMSFFLDGGNFKTEVYHPIHEDQLLEAKSRSYDRSSINLGLGASYSHNSLKIRLGINYSLLTTTSADFRTDLNNIEAFFDFEQNLSASLETNEYEILTNGLKANLIPNVIIEYEFMENWDVRLSLDVKPYGARDFYRLNIRGHTVSTPQGKTLELNDIRLKNKLLRLNLGLTYQIF